MSEFYHPKEIENKNAVEHLVAENAGPFEYSL
jgi:hypothetical protein